MKCNENDMHFEMTSRSFFFGATWTHISRVSISMHPNNHALGQCVCMRANIRTDDHFDQLCSLAPRAHYIFATLHIHTNSFGIRHSCIHKSNGIKRKKKVSPCTMKAIVPELEDMIGVVGRLRTKHDWN